MFVCGTCEDVFYDREDFEEHLDDFGHWIECETCTRTFTNCHASHQHMNALGHWAPVFECESCNREFRSQHAANQHMNAAGHWKPKVPCEMCGKLFYTDHQASQHMNAVGHWAPKISCETCTQKFQTQAAANAHMYDEAHYKHYCKPCNRQFLNDNNLQMHLNSKTHRGVNVPCPFCATKYTSASGLTHHLETGSCSRAPSLNREKILDMVRQRDPSGVITNKQLEYHQEDNVTYSASSKAYNGDYWECYLCHNLFNTVQALNQHLNSPTHKARVYHCPNSKGRCGKEFISLAALFNHLECEACSFMRFEQVQQRVGDVLQGRKLIAFV